MPWRRARQYSCLENSMDRGAWRATAHGAAESDMTEWLRAAQHRWWSVKNPLANAGDRRCGFHPWVRKIPWKRKWQATPAFWLGEFHGQRSLAGYCPWGHKESDTTEHTFIIFKTGRHVYSSIRSNTDTNRKTCSKECVCKDLFWVAQKRTQQ